MKPEQWLKWICASEDQSALIQNYNQWASQYEADISSVWDAVPTAAAAMLALHVKDKQSLIVDIGAGTGLAGQALHKLGFNRIIGMDISASMLEIAASKSIYHSLHCCTIDSLTLSTNERPDAMIATGVFADKHASAADLVHLGTLFRTQGIIVFTVRASFLKEITPVFNRPEWQLSDSRVLPIYEDPIHLLTCHIQPTIDTPKDSINQ